MNLKEIEARHERDERSLTANAACREDRAWLIAEVKRLKELCGRAERWMGGNRDTLSSVERKSLQAELKEART